MVNRGKGQGRLLAVLRGVALGVIAAASAGCSDEACFSWTKDEGACPSQEEALQFFVPVGCTGEIESVDSDPEFIEDDDDAFPGDLCCYSVTRTDTDFAFCNSGGPPF